MARVFLAGKTGQLGSKLLELLSTDASIAVQATDRAVLDVTQRDAVLAAMRAFRPDWIVNCTAYNDVEKAEVEPGKADLVNDTAVGHLADAALEQGARLLHVSTDYVFSGDFGSSPRRPYVESDPPGPLSAYARSKRKGEARLESHAARSAVLRTSWLYGGPGKSFLHTMLRVGREALRGGKPVRVVSDQLGVPTDAWSLAAQVQRLLREDARGLFHASSHGEASWFDFAREIFRLARVPVAVEPIRLADYSSKARRPLYSVLENRRLRDAGLDGFPDWREGLERAWRRIEARPC